MQVKKIYYRTDFRITESAPSLSVPFVFRFFTKSPGRAYEASFDGVEYRNCSVDGDGRLTVAFDDHDMGMGVLMVQRTYFRNSSDFGSGVFDQRMAPAKVVVEYEDLEGMKQYCYVELGLDGEGDEMLCTVPSWYLIEIQESDRRSAEESRVVAELLRGENESVRVEAENSREAAEWMRVEAESLREVAERSREDAESRRDAAEIVRESRMEAVETSVSGALSAASAASAAAAEVASDMEGLAADLANLRDEKNELVGFIDDLGVRIDRLLDGVSVVAGIRADYDSEYFEGKMYLCTDTKEILYDGEVYGPSAVSKKFTYKSWRDDQECVLTVRQDGNKVTFSGEVGGWAIEDKELATFDVPGPSEELWSERSYEGHEYAIGVCPRNMGSKAALVINRSDFVGGSWGSGNGNYEEGYLPAYFREDINFSYTVD